MGCCPVCWKLSFLMIHLGDCQTLQHNESIHREVRLCAWTFAFVASTNVLHVLWIQWTSSLLFGMNNVQHISIQINIWILCAGVWQIGTNFLQVTSFAIAINSDWSESVRKLLGAQGTCALLLQRAFCSVPMFIWGNFSCAQILKSHKNCSSLER